MSIRIVAVLVKWILTADEKTNELFTELRKIPLDKRYRDPRLIETVQNLKSQLNRNRMEIYATLGWQDVEACTIISEALENLEELRKEYKKQVKKYGKPPEWNNEDLERFEQAIKEENKKLA